MGNEVRRTRVLIVEDDPRLRAELAEVVGGAADLELVGAFGSGGEALAFEGTVELALVDLGLPDVEGPDLIRLLKQRLPELDVLVHTVQEDRAVVFDAIVGGASGYVLKGLEPELLLASLRELRDGGAPMSPRIAREVIAAFRHQGTVAARYELSTREREVLGLLDEGLSYKEIAAQLHVSTHTVHTHIKRTYEKLHASNKGEALAKAKLRGMI